MQGKTKKILLGSIVLLVLIIGVVLFNLYNNGFKFWTYTTENYIKEQVEGIISMDDGKDYEGKIEELAVKEINGSYLGFFCIKEAKSQYFQDFLASFWYVKGLSHRKNFSVQIFI